MRESEAGGSSAPGPQHRARGESAPRGHSAASFPALDTTRLTLRTHTAADFADSTAMWADPAVTRHIGGRPSTAEETWARVLRYAGHWTLLGFGYWAVRERGTGRFVGEVGLADYRREMTPALDAPEVGWVLAPWAHGRGLATESVEAALAWADAQAGSSSAPPALATGRTACAIAPENVASVRVAEKCGFRRTGSATYRGAALAVLTRHATAGP